MEWNIYKPNAESIKSIIKLHNVSKYIAIIIDRYGLSDINKFKNFINPNSDNFYDPFLMKGMVKTVERISETIRLKKKIFIIGDNDADGITATLLLYNEIKQNGGIVKTYISNREIEGRGLSKKGINQAINYKSDILITCDCGMNSYKNIEYANKNNIDVIITDHHILNENYPNAFSVLNPKQVGCDYPFKELSGSGIIFKLVQGMIKKRNKNINIINETVNFAMLGTISDMVPLIDENRLIIYFGLKNIFRTKNIGLKKILKNIKSKNSISTFDLSYNVLPKINSIARFGNPNKIIDFFTTNDKKKINQLYSEIEQINNTRLKIQNYVLNDVYNFINTNLDLKKEKIIICFSKNWNYGILGLIASKIRNEFRRPVILISFNDLGIGRGSARSVEGFDLLDAFKFVKSNLISYGGHKMASGIKIEKRNLNGFIKILLKYTNSRLKKHSLKREADIDLKINLSDIKLNLLSFLKKLEPYGEKNNCPKFLVTNVKIIGNPKIFGRGMHIKFKIQQQKTIFNAIAYGFAYSYKMLIKGLPLDLIFIIENSKFHEKDIIQLNIKNIRLSGINNKINLKKR